jgi:PAS domain S-box-containing protein
MKSELLHIVLIEDNPSDAKLFELSLRKSMPGGFNLIACGNLDEGRKFLENNSTDVIVLDLSLPDSTGLSGFEFLHGAFPDLPIIVLTGSDNELSGISAVKQGAQDFLVKGKIEGQTLIRSITYGIERNRFLRELTHNSQKLEEAEITAKIGSWEQNMESGYTHWSPGMYPLLEFDNPTEKKPDQSILQFVDPRDQQRIRDEQKKVLAQEGFSERSNFWIITKKGNSKYLSAYIRKRIDEKGKLSGIYGTLQDISEMKKMQDQLKRSEAQYRNLVEESGNMLYTTDTYGYFTFVNKKFRDIFGAAVQEFTTLSFDLIATEEWRQIAKDHYRNQHQHKIPQTTIEIPVTAGDGSEIWVQLVTTLVTKRGTITGFQTVVHDITDVVKANREMQRAAQLAEEAREMQKSFLANMSHEIRTPLNAILGFSNILKTSRLDSGQVEYVDAITISGENLLGIINDILDFSKIESGNLTIEYESLHLPSLLQNIKRVLQEKAHEKSLWLNINLEADVPEWIKADKIRMNQILLNLCANAIKFTDTGGVDIACKILSTGGENSLIEFRVKDSGIGIPPEKHELIFERFKQADNHTNRKYGGTGLGLSITRKLVELMEGRISVESMSGAGSTFIVTLPLETTPALPEQVEKKRELMPIIAPGVRILLAEDNDLNQKYALKILQKAGVYAEVVNNGQEALELLKERSFHLILMDLQMPVMDGYVATSFIRNVLKLATPIIAMTAHSMSEERKNCLSKGMDDYISKPFKPQELLGKIKSYTVSVPQTRDVDTLAEKVTQRNGVDHHSLQFDLDTLREISDDDDDFVEESIRMVLKGLPADLNALDLCIQESGYDQGRKIAHKLKSSFGLFNAPLGMELCDSIERNADPTQMLGLFEELSGYSRQFISELKSILS